MTSHQVLCQARGAAMFAAATFALTAQAEITYKVSVLPEAGMLHVSMLVPHTDRGCNLQIPNWGPGGYRLNDNYRRVSNLAATTPDGKPISIEAKMSFDHKRYEENGTIKFVDNPICTWIVQPSHDTTIQYDIPLKPVDGSMHWGGPQTYLYEVDRKNENCRLEIKVPTGWPIYTGLNQVSKGGDTSDFVAKNYDTLADNPVSTGDLTVDSYLSRGKTHWIVMRGAARANVDRAKLLQACKFVSDMETDFFGDSAPYDHYVWHFAVNNAPDGAGGLEHLSSTQISLAAGVGPRAVSVLAHEFFHLWNVKRIRSKPLGPFDYTKLPKTGAIWWLEGVTDYYALTLLHRYGWTNDDSYFATIASNLQAVRRNPAHSLVGPYESSMRVDEASGGKGNSNGYLISYYNLGWLAGMALDIDMRSQTASKHNLDDVEHALWHLCRNDRPGFEEDEIRRQLIRFGGAAMGPIYDRVVMKPDGMEIEDTLAMVGLAVITKPESYVDTGFTVGGGPGAAGIFVTSATGPAFGRLMVHDEIASINGTSLQGVNGRERAQALAAITRGAKAGVAMTLTVVRNGAQTEVSVTPVSALRDAYSVERIPNSTSEQRALCEAWLARKAAKP